jgi:hypothetical protein
MSTRPHDDFNSRSKDSLTSEIVELEAFIQPLLPEGDGRAVFLYEFPETKGRKKVKKTKKKKGKRKFKVKCCARKGL